MSFEIRTDVVSSPTRTPAAGALWREIEEMDSTHIVSVFDKDWGSSWRSGMKQITSTAKMGRKSAKDNTTASPSIDWKCGSPECVYQSTVLRSFNKARYERVNLKRSAPKEWLLTRLSLARSQSTSCLKTFSFVFRHWSLVDGLLLKWNAKFTNHERQKNENRDYSLSNDE